MFERGMKQHNKITTNEANIKLLGHDFGDDNTKISINRQNWEVCLLFSCSELFEVSHIL